MEQSLIREAENIAMVSQELEIFYPSQFHWCMKMQRGALMQPCVLGVERQEKLAFKEYTFFILEKKSK